MAAEDHAPSRDDILESLEDAEIYKEGLEAFHEKAAAYDADYERRSPKERPLHIDELPYGEEVKDAESSIKALEGVAERLADFSEREHLTEEDIKEYYELDEMIRQVESDLKGYEALPGMLSEEDEDDGAFED